MRSQDLRKRLAVTLVCALGSTLLLAAPRLASAQVGTHDQKDETENHGKGAEDIRVTAIAPEGSSLLLVSAGLLPLVGVGLWYRRRQRRQA